MGEATCHNDKGRRRVTALMAFITLTFFLSGLTACSPADVAPERAPRPVKVMRTSLEEQEIKMVLQGEVIPGEVGQVSFLVFGRIEALYVKREDVITPDTLLGRLDSTDYQIGLRAAGAVLQSAQANLDKALAGVTRQERREMELQVTKTREAFGYADQQYQRMTALHQAGGIAQSDLERAELERIMAEASYLQASAQFERMGEGARPEEIAALTGQRDAALAEVDHFALQVSRTALYAHKGGVVAQVFYRQGELYHQGTPLLLVNSPGQVVRISLSQQQFNLVQAGDIALIESDQQTVEGQVIMVSGTPDPLTRTHRGEIQLPEGGFALGQLVRVHLRSKGMVGTSLPMKAVLAGNPDYVYVIEDQVALQVPVQVQGADGNRLWVTGLTPGQLVVVEGMHLLSQGEAVGRVEEVVEP